MCKVRQFLKLCGLFCKGSLALGKVNSSKGFSLIELLLVIVIIGILGAIAVISVVGMSNRAEKEVCNTNRLQLERDYQYYILLEDKEDLDITFAEFLISYGNEVCPVGGEIRYVDGEVECSIHSHEGEEENGEEDNGGDVPYL